MNPEIKAKVNEILKTRGIREVSMDEMDKVSGGWGSENNPLEININGAQVDEATFNNMVLEVMNSFGYDVALEVAQDLTNYPFVREGMHTSRKSAKGNMEQVLKDFWYSVEIGNYMGH